MAATPAAGLLLGSYKPRCKRCPAEKSDVLFSAETKACRSQT